MQNMNPITSTDEMSLNEKNTLLNKLQLHEIELEMQNAELRRNQQTLEISRKRYFDIYDHTPIGYCTLDKKSIIHETNTTLALWLGVEGRSLLDKPFTLFILAEDQDIFYLFRKQIIDPVSPSICELRLKGMNDKLRTVNFSLSMQDDFPYSGMYHVVLTDLTAIRLIAQELRLCRDRYDAIVENQSEFVCRYQPNGNLTFVNGAYARYCKIDSNKLIAQHFCSHIPEPDLTMALREIERIIPENPVINYMHRIIRPVGEIRFQRWKRTGIYSEHKMLMEYQAIGNDITEFVLAENAIRMMHAENRQFWANT